MIKLIGLIGPMGSGKDTVCNLLKKHLSNREVVRIAFADALKKEVAEAITYIAAHSVTGENIDKNIAFIDKYKENFRLILQGWGTDFRRKLFGKDYWVDRWMEGYGYELYKADIYEHDILVVATDVRFQNEYDKIKELGGIIVRINRPILITDLFSKIKDMHISESASLSFIADCHIDNDSLDVLESDVQNLIKHYQLDTTQ